jgi:CDP-archaeol synthase
MSNSKLQMDATRILFLAFPFMLTGVVHVVVIKRNWFQGLARLPLDCGSTLRSRRLFGDNKTLRGAVTVIVSVTFFTAAEAEIARALGLLKNLAMINLDRIYPLIWGFLLGTGWVLGELPNSLIKRQLDIGPGRRATGLFRPVFWLADQVDSVIGILLISRFLWHPSVRLVALLLAFTVAIHSLGDWLMTMLGLKVRTRTIRPNQIPRTA